MQAPSTISLRPLSPAAYAAVFAMLATAMIATRVSHFGDALHLPDASMAVFFLGGAFLRGGAGGVRTHAPFLVFAALAGVIDWASITFAGTSDFCVTVAYSFLLPAYAVLWYGGRRAAGRVGAGAGAVGLAATVAVALAAASVSFLISNGAFYWLGGRYENPHMAEYLARLWQWGPLFVRTTMAYVVAVLAVEWLVAPIARAARGAPAARA